MRLGLFLLALPLVAANVVIDCGSATDSGFTGGFTFTAAGVPGDATLRFDTKFSYRIPATGPQVLTLRFLEPSVTVRGQRIFNVTVNNQPMIQSIDLVAEAGFQKPLSRSMVVMPADGALNIVFTASVRSAVVSAIELTPLADLMPAGGGSPGRIETFTLSGTSTIPVTGTPREVFRNGSLQREPADYTISGSTLLFPLGKDGDLITISY